MRHGVVLLPEHSWASDGQKRWQLAEALGYDHAWTYDHLVWRWFASRSWYSAIPTLTAAACATNRIQLGLLVTTPNFRQPALLARELATIDDLAGHGRVICGLGAGAPGPDARIAGGDILAPRARASRFESFVKCLDGLLVDGTFDARDEWFPIDEASFHPRAASRDRRVPFAIAATGPRGTALAAEFGQYWVTSGAPNDFSSKPWRDSLPLLRQQLDALEAACESAGRDPDTIARIAVTDGTLGDVLASVHTYEEAAGALSELGFTDLVVHWPRPDDPFHGDEDVLIEFASRNLEPTT